jgi:predicted alpha/beta hydrolase family esterase
VYINSDNDPHVPLEDGEVLRDELGAKLIVCPGGGHLNEKSGFTEFPLVLEGVLGLSAD